MAIADNCSPRLIQVDGSCGCSLTRANISAFTPEDFEAQGFKETQMDRIIAQTKEARMTGVLQKSLTDLMLSRMTPIRRVNLSQAAGQSVIAPFIMVPQRSNINANYFVIQSGAVNANAGVGSMPASAYDFTVINEASAFASPLVNLENYFLPGRYLVVLNKNAITGVGHTLSYKIIAAVNADAGGVSKAAVTVEPNYSASGWSGLSSDDKAVYQTNHGLVVPLANSVSDFESWCYQETAENTMKLLVFWLQTIRETHCYNEEYLKALNAPLTSNYFKLFRQLPLAQQKKRQAYLAERAFYNTIFYGQRINENQTTSDYTDLPQVVDPANTDCVLEYKANTIGIRQQLADCGKVTDLQGAALDLDVLKTLLYTLKRQRAIDSGEITRIDVMTDRFTADNILTTMISYYKDKYSVNTERFYQPNQKMKFNEQILWNYNVYEFPDEAVELAVITDTYFDDHLAAFPSADKTRGRALWAVDWSDFAIGVAGTNSATRQTNVLDNLYNCVIQPNVNHYQLTSKTVAVMLPDPNRHAVFENFSDACPSITATACSASS